MSGSPGATGATPRRAAAEPGRDTRRGPARIGAVVVAAGSGDRLGASTPKALVELRGRSLLAHTLAGLAAAGLPPAVVVHTPGAGAAFAAATGGLPVAALVPGGHTRTASVAAGVAALDDDVEVVAVHDAARPLTPPGVIAAAVEAVPVGGDVLAAAPGIPVADTLKRTTRPAGDRTPTGGAVGGGAQAAVRGGGGDLPEVVATVDRTGMVGIQTPQVFTRRVLATALRAVAEGREATDDLALVEELRDAGRLTGRIVVVPGSVWSRKVTYRADLELLELLAAHADPGTLDPGGGQGGVPPAPGAAGPAGRGRDGGGGG